MIAIKVIVLAGLPGCVHAKPWRATSSVTTMLEGKRLEIATGYEVEARCKDKADPMWGWCSHSSSRVYRMQLRWGDAILSVVQVAAPGPSRERSPRDA